MAERLVVHDPRGYPPKVVGKRLAPRLPMVEGKTVYLVDCMFDNSDVFTEQLRQWFGEHQTRHGLAARRYLRRGTRGRGREFEFAANSAQL